MHFGTFMRNVAAALALAGAVLLSAGAVRAQEAVTLQLSVKNHQFQPAELAAPANKRIVLRIRNLDATPMEFESVPLRVEKVIPGKGEGVVNLRPLAPGRYNFFDDFNQSAKGTLVVQ